MSTFTRSLLYGVLVLLLISNILLFAKLRTNDEQMGADAYRLTQAAEMFRKVTSCEFVPPMFNEPIEFATRDMQTVKMTISHVFENEGTNYQSLEYQQKIDSIVGILALEASKHTLEELQASKGTLEETVANIYNNKTIKPVLEFSIIELCLP